ncbi:MAG: hypothetical protein SFW08_14055 [Gemmatimonadaceae bacterium]|nr:hypothetical protein [Gemmatimonadaceae bacterium]
MICSRIGTTVAALALIATLAACRDRAPGPATVTGFDVSSMADDRDAARLCGFLALQPQTPMRLPLPAGQDTTLRPVQLAYLDGPGMRGLRVLLPSPAPAYVFRGVSRNGRQRAAFVRVLRSAATGAALLQPGDSLVAELRQLDSVAVHWSPSDSTPGALNGTLPDTATELDRAVPDIRELPDSPLALDAACPSATVGSQLFARVERIFRVQVPAGTWVLARARGAQSGVVMAFDFPARVDSGRTNLRAVFTDSIYVADDSKVTIRLLTSPNPRTEPPVTFVTLSVALRRGSAPAAPQTSAAPSQAAAAPSQAAAAPR